MSTPDGFRFRKPQASNDNGACFFIADNLADTAGVVAVEDTKDNGNGPRLLIPTASWRKFIAGVKSGEIAR